MSPKLNVTNETEYVDTFRAEKVRSQFDIPKPETLSHELTLDWELPNDWNVGLIVGPSGSGKSTLARQEFDDVPYYDGGEAIYEWPDDKSVVDGFADEHNTSEITEALSRVGFSSPPTWLQPYHTLSTGQRFRADMARVLLDGANGCKVVDEFTSTVDRTVAKSISNAVSGYVREENQQIVLVTCHYDAADWLEPDWFADLQREEVVTNPPFQRPEIEVEVRPVRRQAWEIFSDHHYLDKSINPAAQCWVGFWNDEPVTFVGVLHFPHHTTDRFKRITRVVTLPDYQGLGIGTRVLDSVAGRYRDDNYRVTITTSHPGLLRALNNKPEWMCTRGLSRHNKQVGDKKDFNNTTSGKRKTATFEYTHNWQESMDNRFE